MFARRSVVYEYDGTLEGFFCCVFESFARKETPCDVRPSFAPQMTLSPVRLIRTDPQKAARVGRAIPKRISQAAKELIEDAFLTFLEGKEGHMLAFLQLGFEMGPAVMRHLTDDRVAVLCKAQRHLLNEAHRYKQFIRFSVSGGVMTSVIKPLNQVLPLLAPHFIDRYPQEAFLIYDQAHGMALCHRPGQAAILPVDSFVPNDPDEEELSYRELWCGYYDAIAVEGRENPKLRRNHMPKRYWDEMTEFCRELKPGLRRAAAWAPDGRRGPQG